MKFAVRCFFIIAALFCVSTQMPIAASSKAYKLATKCGAATLQRTVRAPMPQTRGYASMARPQAPAATKELKKMAQTRAFSQLMDKSLSKGTRTKVQMSILFSKIPVEPLYFASRILLAIGDPTTFLAQSSLGVSSVMPEERRVSFMFYDFSNTDLNGLELSKDFDFSYSNFSYANLKGLKINGAKFYRCNFYGANVTDIDLRGSGLTRKDLNNVILTDEQKKQLEENERAEN